MIKYAVTIIKEFNFVIEEDGGPQFAANKAMKLSWEYPMSGETKEIHIVKEEKDGL